MTATSSAARSKTHFRAFDVLCFVAAAVSLGLAIWSEDQRADFMSQWPDPYADPQAYGLSPETATLSQSEIESRFGWEVSSRTTAERAGANSRYRSAEWQAQKIADRRDIFALSAVALLLLPFLIHGFVYFTRRGAQKLQQAGRSAAPHLANATAAVLAKSRDLSSNNSSITRGNLSTADELRKWTDLRNEGLISEEEFLKMRAKILG